MTGGQWRPIKPLTAVLNYNAPINRGLVFDGLLIEKGGTTSLDTAGKIAGSVTGTPTRTADYYGACLTFAGATDGVTYAIPTGSPVESMSSFSYEFLINMTGLGGASTGYVVCKSNAGPPYFLVSCKSSTTLQILSGYATTQGSWSIPITENAWHHVVVTYTFGLSNVPVAYVDGVLVTVTTATSPSGTAPTDTAFLYIGNNSAGTRNWAGEIAYVRAWNRVLSQPEVTDLNENPWVVYSLPGLLAIQ